MSTTDLPGKPLPGLRHRDGTPARLWPATVAWAAQLNQELENVDLMLRCATWLVIPAPKPPPAPWTENVPDPDGLLS